jgi:hypothetical protein
VVVKVVVEHHKVQQHQVDLAEVVVVQRFQPLELARLFKAVLEETVEMVVIEVEVVVVALLQ